MSNSSKSCGPYNIAEQQPGVFLRYPQETFPAFEVGNSFIICVVDFISSITFPTISFDWVVLWKLASSFSFISVIYICVKKVKPDRRSANFTRINASHWKDLRSFIVQSRRRSAELAPHCGSVAPLLITPEVATNSNYKI